MELLEQSDAADDEADGVCQRHVHHRYVGGIERGRAALEHGHG